MGYTGTAAVFRRKNGLHRAGEGTAAAQGKETKHMELLAAKEFPFSMETAWEALQQPAKLDVEPGSKVVERSATEWEAHNLEAKTCNVYTASFDEANRQVTIEGKSEKKHERDYIYLTLTEAGEGVCLDVKVEINTGAHLLAKLVGKLISGPTQKILSEHVFSNFEALCTGGELRTLTQDDLKAMAKAEYVSKEMEADS